jgi:hypothetical protein
MNTITLCIDTDEVGSGAAEAVYYMTSHRIRDIALT